MSQPPPGPAPDVISAGPRIPRRRLAGRAAAGLLAIALAAAVLAAVHYHGQTEALRAAASRAPRSAGPVALAAATAALPPAGTLTGEVTAVTASTAGGQAQVIITAQITGARPHTRYELSGGDCTSDTASVTWAAGTTSAAGSADLTGPARQISASHEYFLVLGAPGLYQNHPGPAVHGRFTTGRLSPVHGDVAPCAP
jgi:hypothetical protein